MRTKWNSLPTLGSPRCPLYSRYVSYAGAQPYGADFISESRCGATRFDVRCQLRAGHDPSGPHMAMMRHLSSRQYGYAVWAPDGRSSWEAEVGDQQWAPTFPRVA
jgi:hypothetical protein